MRNYPKHINNREDLNYLLNEYPIETKKFLSDFYESRLIWQIEKELISEEDGITDDTHKIQLEVDLSADVKHIYQMILVEDLNLLKRFEFNSFNEVLDIINSIEV